MCTQLTREEAINQQYELFKQKRTEKQTEDAEAKRLQEEHRAEIQATIKKSIKIVTVRKPHKCRCGSVIAKGEKASVYSGVGMVAWEKGEHGDVLGHYTEYTCQQCRPIKEEA